MSNAGEPADWGLEKIEVNWLGPQNSYAKLYVIGRENLATISSGQQDLFDLLETEVSYGEAESYSQKNDSVTFTCSCSYNTYNCSDFYTQVEAQACFEYCYPVSGDIHWLDDDGDGRACELLP